MVLIFINALCQVFIGAIYVSMFTLNIYKLSPLLKKIHLGKNWYIVNEYIYMCSRLIYMLISDLSPTELSLPSTNKCKT